MSRIVRGLHELYREDPERADALLQGLRARSLTRRGFFKGTGSAALGLLLGGALPLDCKLPRGLIPAALADATEEFELEGKGGLIVLNDRPVNAETPAHLLDDEITPASRLFVRNHGLVPEQVDVEGWTLEVTGESALSSRRFSLAALKREFETHTYQLQLECAGNGRAEFYPPASGNQWTTGAVGCSRFTGVRLRDVLDACGVAPDAAYVAYVGADRHLSGDPNRTVFSRGVPIAKAREDESLIAWSINGEDLPLHNGYPLRLVCAGWPGSTSGKWLTQLLIRNQVHDGPGMSSYRLPCQPVAPGELPLPDQLCIIESMPVKSLVTLPRSGSVHALGTPIEVRGHAWAGDRTVSRVEVSIDFGQSWQLAALGAPPNRLAWQRFRTLVRFPSPGYYEIWARATDSEGRAQPMVVPGWNPQGYNNNACHRVAVRILQGGEASQPDPA